MINTQELFTIFMDCLFNDEEVVDGKPVVEPVYVHGIVNNMGFHPERLESHRDKVKSMVNQLDYSFKEGESFLKLCIDKNGNHWGEHKNCEQLLTLAVGLDIMEYMIAPSSARLVMPGGMPLVKIMSGVE